MSYLFKKIALGGTFEIIHKGHVRLLNEAYSISKLVVIGLSSDALTRRLGKAHPVRRFNERLIQLKSFLNKRGWLSRTEIVELNDPYGPTISDPEIEAIIVSEETLDRAFEINEIRNDKGLRSLAICVVKLVLAENGKPISTTRIYRGEIDREGRLINPSG